MPVPKINKTPVDRFSFVHLATGIGSGIVGVPAWLALSGSLAFEAFETPMKKRVPKKFPDPSPDTPANAAVDVLAYMAGWMIGNWVTGGKKRG